MTKKLLNNDKVMNRICYFLLFFVIISCDDKQTQNTKLPIMGNYDIVYKRVEGKEIADTIYPKIPFFSYINQDSLLVRSTDLKGKLWIVDFFFTSCSTICPRMTSNMKKINEKLSDISNQIQFISFSIDPKTDKPSIIKKYIQSYHINTKNWVFLTGDEAKTHRLGIDNFMIFAGKEEDVVDGFAHSEAFTLVDKNGYVRGVYNVSQTEQLYKLIADTRLLLKQSN